NVRVWKGAEGQTAKLTAVSATAHARFTGCVWEAGVGVNAAQDLLFQDCVIHGAAHDEFTRNVHHLNGQIHTFCTAHYGTSKVNFLGCRFRRMTQTGANGFVVAGAGEHSLTNCAFDGSTGDRCELRRKRPGSRPPTLGSAQWSAPPRPSPGSSPGPAGS